MEPFADYQHSAKNKLESKPQLFLARLLAPVDLADWLCFLVG